MMGVLKKLLFVVVILVVVLVLGKNLIAKAAIQGGVKAMTGLDLRVAKMDVGLLRSAVGIYGLQVKNPPGFTDPVMVDLPEIFVDYDLPGFFGGRVHLEEVRLNLKEFMVVKNKDGSVNLNSLEVVQQSKTPAKGEPAQEAGGPGSALTIDHLHLKVGRVIYKDYTKGETPQVQEFALNLDEHYRDITNPQVLAGLIVSRALMNTSVARLTGIDVTAVQAQFGSQVQRATGAVSGAVDATKGAQAQAAKQLESATKDVKEAGKDALEGASHTVQQTTDSLKKMLPLGQ
ncbi:MAG TPA: AsmA family protein [bacterium]